MTNTLTGLSSNQAYRDWFNSLKTTIRSARTQAMLAVNQELVLLYWRIGQAIIELQADSQWGDKLLDKLSND
jgi:hypothetical protein